MNQNRYPLIIAYLSFISLGLPDAAIGVAWMTIRQTFELPQTGLGAVLILGGTGYLISSFFAGQLVQRLGVGYLLTLSSTAVTLGLWGYMLAPVWLLFVGWALLIGLGSGAVDARLNSYAASHFSARQLNWLHACYGIGVTLGALIMTGVLAINQSWRWGYAILAVLSCLMTIAFSLTRSLWYSPPKPTPASLQSVSLPTSQPTNLGRTLQQPLVWMHLLIFFAYTGLEVTAGQWSVTLYVESRSVLMETAGIWVGLYWGSLTVGRVLFGFVVAKTGIDRLLRLSMLGVVLGSLCYINQIIWLSVLGLALIGLSLAPIFPCLMAQTPTRLGNFAVHAIGLQVCAAMLGGAILPSLTGLLIRPFSLEVIGGMVVGLALVLWILHETLLRNLQRL